MNIYIYILAGIIIGIAIGWGIKNRKTLAGGDCCIPQAGEKQGIVAEQAEEKEKNLAKIREYIKDKDEITNDEIQKLLDVSDATIVRYLNDLEGEGLLKQIGETGKYTYYQVLKG